MAQALISGGYYIKARCIKNSEIAIAPPHVREIWDWLIRETNRKDRQTHGRIIERGQIFTSYEEIIKALHWEIGFRKEYYTKWQCESAMKWLLKRGMITTIKTTRGMIITLCEYDYYQNPKNYENHTNTDTITTGEPQDTDTIHKKEKKGRIKELKYIPPSAPFQDSELNKKWEEWILYRKEKKRSLTEKSTNEQIIFLKDFSAADSIEIIATSIRNGWQGLFKLKANGNDKRNTKQELPNRLTAGF